MNKYEIVGRMVVSGISGTSDDRVEVVRKLRRLAQEHNRQCTNDCNGEGTIRGKGFVRTDSTAGYADDKETTLFHVAIDKLEAKMVALVKGLGRNYRMYFQRDPRGWTARIEKRSDNVWSCDNSLTEILYA